MTSHTKSLAKPRTWYKTLAESRFGSLQVFNVEVPCGFRLEGEAQCNGSYWQTSPGGKKSRQDVWKYFALPALEELRDWCKLEICGCGPSDLLGQFDLAIAVLNKFTPEMASIGLRQLCRALVESRKGALDWSGASKLACVVAALRDIAEVFCAKGVHELNVGGNRVVADQALWQRKDLGVSFVQAIAQAIQDGDLHRLDPAEVTLAKLHRAWSLSWFGENESPGWFLLLWAKETGNLAALWPAIRAQVKLLLAQNRAMRVFSQLELRNAASCG